METTASQPHVEVSTYPSSVLSGWLPPSDSQSWTAYFKDIHQRYKEESQGWHSTARDLYKFLTTDETAKHYFMEACDQNKILLNNHKINVPIPRIKDAKEFASYCDALLTQSPTFVEKMLVGLPFSALASGLDATIGGARCFSLPGFSKIMGAILNEWHKYLESPDSAWVFSKEGEQWLSPEAKKSYNFDVWVKDSETLPYWKSWNSFFTRRYKDMDAIRPIASPNTNQIVCSPNDGSLFRWDWNVAEEELFWFKDMNYSLRHIFSSDISEQQELMDKHKLVEMFKGGYIFQSFLNPYKYHHWWVPVNGKILFDPFIIPGVYFNKLVKPDFEGTGTASLPYLCQVNSRGIIVFDTQGYGLVCCIPLGMSEVSTIEFNAAMKRGATVKKGQEMGMFKYGGSSFAMLFQNLPGKELVFHNGQPKGLLPPRPVLPTTATSDGGSSVTVGAQIGIWYDITKDHNHQ